MNGTEEVSDVELGSQFGEANISFKVTIDAPGATGSDEQKAAKLDAAISALAANDSPYVGAIPTGDHRSKIRVIFGDADSSYAATGGATASSALTLTQNGTTHKWNTEYTISNLRVSLVGASTAEELSDFSGLVVNLTVGHMTGNPAAFTAYDTYVSA